jgi:hypothetical protein
MTLAGLGCSGPQPAVEHRAPGRETRAVSQHSASVTVAGFAPSTGNSDSPAIIILKPGAGSPPPPPAPVPYMDQVARTFVPPILFVRSGHPAEFRNSDPEIHNVNVKDARTFRQAFNVAIPTDERFVHTFAEDGVYEVSCDVHAGMAAQVVVSSSPYVTVADAEGRFTFVDIQPGAYDVTVYAGPKTIERSIDVSGTRTDLDLR